MEAEETIEILTDDLEEARRDGQLAFNGMCEFLEWHMATYEYIKDLKKTSKHELKRHKGMVEKGLLMIRVAAGDYKVPLTCARIRETLEESP